MKQQNAIEFDQLSKTYVVRHMKPLFLDSFFNQKKQEIFTALHNINLEIPKGQKVGIIGPNGSGKTTLLKLISKVTAPTVGRVTTRGRVVSLIDLEAGFHPDLTGEENVYLNGMFVGMKRKEVEKQYQSIVDFAEIGSFIDAPLFTYSTGMKLRLGFAVAIHADPDILILDEGISTGDQGFRKKLETRLEDFFQQNKTILIVTHWTHFLKANCHRILWLDSGKIVKDGGVEILDRYKV
jgi:ABC-type polysaccharide/polyol phosphate transport system ATPase subunit